MNVAPAVLDDLARAAYVVAFALVIIALSLSIWRAARGPAQTDIYAAFFQVWQCAVALIALTAGAYGAADILVVVFGAAFVAPFVAILAAFSARRAALHRPPAERRRSAP